MRIFVPKILAAIANRQIGPLYLAAFFMATSINVWWVALPFIVKRMGGSDTHVGLCFAAQMACYLVGCLLASFVLDQLNPKRVVQAGSAAAAVAMFATGTLVTLAQCGTDFPRPVLLLSITAALFAASTAFFWPPMMGWLSTGYEGGKLNRRLGIFTVSFSCGNILGPYLGGLLVEQGTAWPFAVIIPVSILCFLAACLPRNPRPIRHALHQAATSLGDAPPTPASAPIGVLPAHGPSEPQDYKKTPPLDYVGHPYLTRFRWTARIALLTSVIIAALIRTQLGLLLKFELGFSESTFGMIILTMACASLATFMVIGRVHTWHYVRSLFAAAQIIILVACVLILNSQTITMFMVAAILFGLSNAFLYSSHLFYGVSGRRKRAATMAIHEIILSGGFATGALLGGFLSDRFDPYMPYKFGLATFIVAILAQIIVWFALSQKKPPQLILADKASPR